MISIGLQNSSHVAFALGLLAEARRLATEALNEAEAARGRRRARQYSLAYRAIAAHALGDIAAARADFAAATELEATTLLGRGSHTPAITSTWATSPPPARSPIAAWTLLASTTGTSRSLCSTRCWPASTWPRVVDATPHLDEIRAWTARTGDMQRIIEAHLLAARHLLARGDTQAALGEAETGLLHAVACGYGLLRIELLVALARIRLAWPDPPKAIQAAREALDLATHPDCQYAWGEADAAQVWGEAYFANHEPALAHRAFTQALAVRKRIEHPGVADTEKWLAMTAV